MGASVQSKLKSTRVLALTYISGMEKSDGVKQFWFHGLMVMLSFDSFLYILL